MYPHLDWLSFTLEIEHEPITHEDLYHTARAVLRKVSNDHEAFVFDRRGFEPSTSRAPYRLCLERADHGIRVYSGSTTNTVLFECGGRSMPPLHGHDVAAAFVAPICHRMSRLDYAADIVCDTRPADFANERDSKAFRSISFIRSDTGETVYVGSPKSDRFCRVYRYNPPHPRSHLLRVEYVFKRGLARIAAEDLAESKSASHFAARLGRTWAFTHKVWQPDYYTDEKVKTASTTQRQEDTVAWLYKQVAPAVQRLMADGALDLNDWLQHVFALGPDGD